MGLRYRHRVRLCPWLHVNISAIGASLNVGPRCANINLGRRGAYGTFGLPSSGISYRTKLHPRPVLITSDEPIKAGETITTYHWDAWGVVQVLGLAAFAIWLWRVVSS